jgi:hypothetical protein
MPVLGELVAIAVDADLGPHFHLVGEPRQGPSISTERTGAPLEAFRA